MVALILLVLITLATGCVVIGAVVADARRRGLPVLPFDEAGAAVPAAASAPERATLPTSGAPAPSAAADTARRPDHGHRAATV